jgi:hypothetical protein
MRLQLRASAIALALLAGIGCAAAQTHQSTNQGAPNASPAQGPTQGGVSLNPMHGKKITQGLSLEHVQSAPSDFDGRVGTKVPDSMTPKVLPGDVTAQVPEAQGYLFVKMPDRVLLIDPDSKTVVEIVPALSGSTSN